MLVTVSSCCFQGDWATFSCQTSALIFLRQVTGFFFWVFFKGGTFPKTAGTYWCQFGGKEEQEKSLCKKRGRISEARDRRTCQDSFFSP